MDELEESRASRLSRRVCNCRSIRHCGRVGGLGTLRPPSRPPPGRPQKACRPRNHPYRTVKRLSPQLTAGLLLVFLTWSRRVWVCAWLGSAPTDSGTGMAGRGGAELCVLPIAHCQCSGS